MSDAIRVFIGSGEASLIERKVAIYSLKKHTKRALDVYVFNGTHNAIELNDREPVLAPMSLKLKYKNVTEFSLYRYLIPQICNYQGKAIYVDSDTVCLSDIGELFDSEFDIDFLAKKETDSWALSVMLINCEKCRFDLLTYCNEIEQGLYTYRDFSGMSPKFLQYHPFAIAELDPNWNSYDRYDSATKLIHYTNLKMQPWKAADHPWGELWFQYFREALEMGIITEADIELSILRSYVRDDIREGMANKSLLKKLLSKVR